MKKLKQLQKRWVDSKADLNREKILGLLAPDPNAKILDLGCNDGVWTVNMAEVIKTKNIFGVEIVPNQAEIAKQKGINVKGFDLNSRFDYEDNYFDVVHSNQVIEHLYDTDNFVSEIFRVLKPGGYALISTVNLAGWHNIISLILGYQPFDIANISARGNVGNPFSVWHNSMEGEGAQWKSWQHIRIFTTYGLMDLLKKFEFERLTATSSGYYVLPEFFAKIDPFHGHYIAIKAFKPLRSE